MSRHGLPKLSSVYCNGAPRNAAPLARSLSTVPIHAELRNLDSCRRGSSRYRTYRKRGSLDGYHASNGRIQSPRHFSQTPPKRRLTANPPPPPPRSQKKWYIAGSITIALFTAYYTLLADPSVPDTLNKERFTPCTVVSREPLSPSAFILTIQVPNPSANRAIIAKAHEYGLWSVEVKQPQLQIARNYTPLPPDEEEEEVAGKGGDDKLRFFVRRYETGEVSKYLSRLEPGDTVEIRGPHLGFDLGTRLGLEDSKTKDRRHVVFLAGGTGIAPAMQAARRLLLDDNKQEGHKNISVRIFWANRASADCAGCPRVDEHAKTAQSTWGDWLSFSTRNRPQGTGFSKSEVAAQKAEEEQPGLIIAQWRELQAQYKKMGRKLEVTCAIDEKGSKFTEEDIADAVNTTSIHHSNGSPIDNKAVDVSLTCFYHSQRQLQDCTEELDAGGTDGVLRRCDCGDGERGRGGKNLFIISGPEGFVSSYVGPKIWARGAERQGPVGGVVAELMRKNPAVWRDWLILKQ